VTLENLEKVQSAIEKAMRGFPGAQQSPQQGFRIVMYAVIFASSL
jgi:hypothetical protein